MDAFEGRIEQVAQQSYGTACLFVNQCRKLGRFLYLDNGVFPMFQQYFKLAVQFGHPLALGHGAYDDAEVLGLDAHEQLLEAGALGAGFDFLRYRHLVVERYQYEVASGKRQFGRQSRALGRDGLFDYLHHYFLSYLECVGHRSVLFKVGKQGCLGYRIEFLAVA